MAPFSRRPASSRAGRPRRIGEKKETPLAGRRASGAITGGVNERVALDAAEFNRDGEAAQMARIIAYVDGFNLYYGLRSQGWRRLYWLDVHRLAENLLKPGQRLLGVHYFTTRIRSRPGDEDTRRRQGTYLEALKTLPGVRLHYGHYLAKTRRCPRCQATWETFEEKMTDVNIAVELLGGAQDDAFDTAILVSGDSDLTRPVQAVQTRYPIKRVVVAFPPNRTSSQLRDAASAGFVIGRKKLLDSQLPDRLIQRDGHVLTRPQEWR